MPDDATATAAPALSTSGTSGSLVLIGGAATTALALFGVYLLDEAGTNVMGWYGDYVIPVGAALVGLVASSGYGVASWMTGTKISGRLLVAVVALLTGGYFLAKYLEFRLLFPGGATLDDGTSLGFWRYFDIMSRSFAFEDNGKPGSPLGNLGYGLRALEILGFVGGGILVPMVLRKKPYCESCQRYKRTLDLAWLPASVPHKRVSKKSPDAVAAYNTAQLEADKQGRASLATLLGAGSKGDGATLTQELAARCPPGQRKQTQKLPARISIALIHCRRCRAGI